MEVRGQLQESVLSYFCVGPEDRIQAMRLGSKLRAEPSRQSAASKSSVNRKPSWQPEWQATSTAVSLVTGKSVLKANVIFSQTPSLLVCLLAYKKIWQWWETAQLLKALATLASDLGVVTSTHRLLVNVLHSSFRESRALFWPSRAPRMNTIHLHTCKQNTHPHNIKTTTTTTKGWGTERKITQELGI